MLLARLDSDQGLVDRRQCWNGNVRSELWRAQAPASRTTPIPPLEEMDELYLGLKQTRVVSALNSLQISSFTYFIGLAYPFIHRIPSFAIFALDCHWAIKALNNPTDAECLTHRAYTSTYLEPTQVESENNVDAKTIELVGKKTRLSRTRASDTGLVQQLVAKSTCSALRII